MFYKSEPKSPVTLSELREIAKEEAATSLNGQFVSVGVDLRILSQELGRDWLKPGEHKVILSRLARKVREATERTCGMCGDYLQLPQPSPPSFLQLPQPQPPSELIMVF